MAYQQQKASESLKIWIGRYQEQLAARRQLEAEVEKLKEALSTATELLTDEQVSALLRKMVEPKAEKRPAFGPKGHDCSCGGS